MLCEARPVGFELGSVFIMVDGVFFCYVFWLVVAMVGCAVVRFLL